MMNLDKLEKLARQALEGTDIARKSNLLLRKGAISFAEHRSLNSEQWMSRARLNGSGAGASVGVYASSKPQGFWF